MTFLPALGPVSSSSSDSVLVEEMLEPDAVVAGAAEATAGTAAVELPAAIWKAMTPPKGPAPLGLASFTRQTFCILPTLPLQVVPAGTWTAKG